MDFPHFLRALWRAALGLDAPLSDVATTSHTEKSCYNYEEASSPVAEDSHEGDDELSADLRHGSLPPRSSLTVAEWAVLEPFYRAQTWQHLGVRSIRQSRGNHLTSVAFAKPGTE